VAFWDSVKPKDAKFFMAWRDDDSTGQYAALRTITTPEGKTIYSLCLSINKVAITYDITAKQAKALGL
jgi:hypothetical protein